MLPPPNPTDHFFFKELAIGSYSAIEITRVKDFRLIDVKPVELNHPELGLWNQ